MGITKLLPELSEFTSTDVDLSVVLKAKRVVVDASVWLHQFLFYFATATNHEEVIVARVVRRARRLIELGAFVIVVLDSIDTVMPAKAITIEERRIRRAEAYARATGGEDSSKQTTVSQYHVTDKLVRHLITRLHRDGFTYVVAPFEADHQMVHLVKGGHADYVLTVDSDVASHGVPIVSHTDWSTLRGTVVHVQTGEGRHSQSRVADAVHQHGTEILHTLGALVGCDYGGEIGVGWAKALDILAAGDVHDKYPNVLDREKAFRGGWVYDITTKKCCTLDGSEPSEAIVGVLPAGDPNDRALGQMITGDLGDRHQLFRAGDACPQALTYDMVPNSYLSDTRIASSAVTTNELKAWLRARGLPLSHDGRDDKSTLLDMVRAERCMEKERADKGDARPVRLCCTGDCAYAYLLRTSIVSSSHPSARQHDDALKKYVTTASTNAWECSVATLPKVMPILKEDVLRAHYQHLLDNSRTGDIRVIKEGFRRIATRTYLDGFGMMNITDENYANHVAVKLKVDASMRILKHHVYAVFDVSTTATCTHCPPNHASHEHQAPPTIRRIVALWCSCEAGLGGQCVHGSSLLHALLNVKREENIETSPTSRLCWWNQPSSSVRSFDVTQPAACLPFFNISINDDDTDRKKSYQHHAHGEDRGRAGRSPWVSGSEPAALEELRNPSPRAREVVHKLFDELKKANGETSALEVTFGRRFDVTDD